MPILADYRCPEHGRFEQMVESPSPDEVPCPALRLEPIGNFFGDFFHDPTTCGAASPWVPFPVTGRVKIGEVQRGTVAKPDSPMMLDTRSLGEGEPYHEWRAKRDKMYEERRHKESKEL